MNAPARELISIRALARELGVTERAIRFYEAKGLLTPSRGDGGNRVYTRRDRARLTLVLRGKRLGFTLREIREYLDLYDGKRDQAEQIRLLLGKTRERIAGLEQQARDLELTLAELRAIERQAEAALHPHIPVPEGLTA